MNATCTRTTRFAAILAALLACAPALADCKVSVSKRPFEGAEHAIITLENERVVVEIVPDKEGRVARYADKQKPTTAFEWLDDCPYHYGARWEGKPFEYRIVEQGPDRAAVTVTGGGKVSVAMLRAVLGVDMANALDLKVERTMTIERDSTRLRIDVKITNVGQGIAPSLRYMVHAVYGQVPPMPVGRAFWFLPTAAGVEFFDPARGGREMGIAGGGAPVDHPFSRFVPGRSADKPRYEPGGWGALLTSAGPTYIFYDPAQFDFIQYWFGGDAEWHFTFEPQSKAVDLKPGESVVNSFTLAYDAKDVPFHTPTVAYERPVVPDLVLPGAALTIKARATTVRGEPEAARLNAEVKAPNGQALVAKTVDAQVKPFEFSDLGLELALPQDAAKGQYSWRVTVADGKELGAGKFEVVSAEDLAKRQMEKATAELQARVRALESELNGQRNELRRLNELWRDGVDLALDLNDPAVWPQEPPSAQTVVTRERGGVRVLGLWQEKESPRIARLTPALPAKWPDNAEQLLAALGADRALVRDVAAEPDGKGLAVLIVDAAKGRAEAVRLGPGGVVKRIGRFSGKPGEGDDTLGAVARAISVDAEGNIWIATNAWGRTTTFRQGADGAPFEESIVGNKGALRKFSPDGRLLGAVSVLDTPMDLILADADGTPAAMVSYRNVTAYHGAQVRQGMMLVRASDVRRIAEIKASAGSVCADEAGRVWIADVAGHVACCTLGGRKLFDVADSPAEAVPDARLPDSSPLPVIVRSDGKGTTWALFTLARKLVAFDGEGKRKGDAKDVPADAGDLYRLVVTEAGPVVVGDKALWRP